METTETTKGETFNYQGHDYDVVEVHIRLIKAGDTVLRNGNLHTVCHKDITYSTFMGKSIFGSNYKSGTKLVKKVLLENVWRNTNHV